MSIAGLGDPDTAKLDARYAEIARRYEKMGATQKTIDAQIEEAKRKDGYDRKPTGLVGDWSFKINDIAEVPEALAESWEKSHVCKILPDLKKAQAS